jgi:pyruvate-formate lyase-activating enzyme
LPAILNSMQPLQVLLLNPPIFDFTAYDFWSRPYGMLRVAGRMKHSCRLEVFDYLVPQKRDSWGRGRFDSETAIRPKSLKDIPRIFHRFGRPREEFRNLLRTKHFDSVLIQTLMTYWYLGVQEAIEDIRELQPSAKIILGGIYATLCPSHARSLGPDLVITGNDLDPLWNFLSIKPDNKEIPFWPREYTDVGVMKITEGCPFHCTYCSAPLFWPQFIERPVEECMKEFLQLLNSGVRNIAFYDDALLFHADKSLIPFLNAVRINGIPVAFHTPNALNARFINPDIARLMVQTGFKSFFLGLESSAVPWQDLTGGKVDPREFEFAVQCLKKAGAQSVVTYIIVGHPDTETQDLEYSIRFAHECGTRVLLSEFSPVPGTADSLKSEKWANLKEPLSHNKTAFAIRRLGNDYLNYLKDLNRSLNKMISV